MDQNRISVLDYHQRTKHHLSRYARGPETLDWDSQPDPFRYFVGSPVVNLPAPGISPDTPFRDLYEQDKVPPQPLNTKTIGHLLELSLALSAWKEYGPDRWTLRINPSSGNLHPTECYLLLAGLPLCAAGLYHYNAYYHRLELRGEFPDNTESLPNVLPASSFILGFSTITKRESWKYGERAYRYCQHDIGHALAAVRYACAVLGWRLTLLQECSDVQVETLLGLNRDSDFKGAERESPDLLVQIHTSPEISSDVNIEGLLELALQANWHGNANRLTDDNFYKWPVIEEIEETCRKPVTESLNHDPDPRPALTPTSSAAAASTLIRKRRSAQAFDGTADELPFDHFVRLLDCLLPRPQTTPFDCLPWPPRVHLVFFVHRVSGLKPGLYAMPRSMAGEELLRQHLRKEFDWHPVPESGLPLYQLALADSRNLSRTLACHQPIASESAFSVAMLGEFESVVTQAPWQYRQLFWEAGMIGQVLYLEAEAASVRGTGIGCYFDDAVGELLAMDGLALQDFYHFTVGVPRVDQRILTKPPYEHLTR